MTPRRKNPSRRTLLAGLAGVGTWGALSGRALAQTKATLVVVGGGFGGSIAARQLNQLMPSASVILIEPNRTYTACPFSNLVISGARRLSQQQYSYAELERRGLKVVHDMADDIDPIKKIVRLRQGASMSYDRLVLAPGIDVRWDTLPGYTQDAAQIMPNAWKAGEQTALLAKQLQSMDDGGLVIMSVPRAPYRCPPGPYERASLIAEFLKREKPRSKLLLLDGKDTFSKQALFEAAWNAHYPDILEHIKASEDGRVSRVAADSMEVETDFETFRADIANIIPPQKAGWIADRAGVTDQTGWCPINAVTFESKLQSGIHIIGDASIAAPMPKSAFSANLQGKICAIQIARLIAGMKPQPTTLANTCYSFTRPDQAISITGVYHGTPDGFVSVKEASGTSPLGAVASEREREAREAVDWYQSITMDSFG